MPRAGSLDVAARRTGLWPYVRDDAAGKSASPLGGGVGVLRLKTQSRVLAVATLMTVVALVILVPRAGAVRHRGRPHDQPAYLNPLMPINQRVADLLSRMTLAEKIGQMTQAERASVDSDTSKITTDKLGACSPAAARFPHPILPPHGRTWSTATSGPPWPQGSTFR